MRVHLHVRILGFVPLEVDLQVPSRREAISAYVAFERSFTCVRADVDLQGTVTAKDLLTQATLVAEKRVVADILGSFNQFSQLGKF